MAQQSQQNIEQYREKVAEKIGKIDKPEEVLSSSLDQLAKVGGFDLLEAALDGVQNLNPERKARKKIFLSEHSKKDERAALKEEFSELTIEAASEDDVVLF